MVPAGYMAKRVASRPGWLKANRVVDLFSVSGCISEDFDPEFIDRWRHNGFWLFNSPTDVRGVAAEMNSSLEGTQLFFYEVYEYQYDEKEGEWLSFQPEASFETRVIPPVHPTLEGFDIVSHAAQSAKECSPLSCNGIAAELPVNEHCLLESFAQAKGFLEGGRFVNCEPGPFRIYAVYSVGLPGDGQ